MKKISFVVLMAIVSLVGTRAYAHNDVDHSLEGKMNLDGNISVQVQGDGRGGDSHVSGSFLPTNGGEKINFDFRGNGGFDDGKNHDANDDHGDIRGDVRFSGGNGWHFGDVIRTVHQRVEGRFMVAYERMSGLQTRLQTRIDKLKSEGKDTASAQMSLDVSVNKLTEAKNYGASAKVILDAHASANPPTEMSDADKAQVKDLFEKSKVALKASFDAFKQSLGMVKSLSVTTSGTTSAEVR